MASNMKNQKENTMKAFFTYSTIILIVLALITGCPGNKNYRQAQKEDPYHQYQRTGRWWIDTEHHSITGTEQSTGIQHRQVVLSRLLLQTDSEGPKNLISCAASWRTSCYLPQVYEPPKILWYAHGICNIWKVDILARYVNLKMPFAITT